ncbi:MAG: hypothetical protein II221_01360 [Paludibacteraceae bacterium]|nr:hypothetical protein [Paludibacteraceae bacterium]
MENMKHTAITWSMKRFAEEVGVSMPTAYQMSEEPGFPLLRVGRKKLVIVSGVERWLAERSAAQTR